MKRVILLATLFTFQLNAFAGLYITANQAEAEEIRSARVLSKISVLPTIDSFRFVFPLDAKARENEIITQFELEQYPKVRLYFDNQFFNYLTAKAAGSNVYLINSKGRIVYQEKLKDVNNAAINYYTHYNAAAIASLPVKHKGIKGSKTNGDLMFTSYVDGTRYNYVYDLAKAVEYDFSFYPEIIEMFYKKFYGKQFDKRFPIIKSYMTTNRGIQPEIWEVRQLERSNDILAEIVLYDTMDKNDDNEYIINYKILAKYNTKDQKFTELYLQSDYDKLKKTQHYFSGLEFIQGELYGRFSDKSSWYTFCKYNFNEATKTYSKTNSCIENAIPHNYDKKISSVYRILYSNDGRAIVYAYADSLFDFKLNHFIAIPFQNESGVKTDFEILGMRYNWVTDNYHIFYTDKNTSNYRLLVFDKESNIILSENVEGGSGDLISPFQLLRYNKERNQFILVDL